MVRIEPDTRARRHTNIHRQYRTEREREREIRKKVLILGDHRLYVMVMIYVMSKCGHLKCFQVALQSPFVEYYRKRGKVYKELKQSALTKMTN